MSMATLHQIRTGKSSPDPQILDQLMLTLSDLKDKHGALLIPRSRLKELAERNDFPYDPQTGYCFEPYKTVFERHKKAFAGEGSENAIPLSIMLRELRTCREINFSIQNKNLTETVSSDKGLSYIERPRTHNSLPLVENLDAFLGAFSEELCRNGALNLSDATQSKMWQEHIALFHKALENGYPRDKDIVFYQAPAHDPWKNHYGVNTGRNAIAAKA
jgi:hypothetical protein